MKLTIDNIKLEGTSSECAEFVRLYNNGVNKKPEPPKTPPVTPNPTYVYPPVYIGDPLPGSPLKWNEIICNVYTDGTSVGTEDICEQISSHLNKTGLKY